MRTENSSNVGETRSELQQDIDVLVAEWETTHSIPVGAQHEVRVMLSAADVLALAEHSGTAFVEVDGWVNTLLVYPGGSTVVYKAPTAAAVA